MSQDRVLKTRTVPGKPGNPSSVSTAVHICCSTCGSGVCRGGDGEAATNLYMEVIIQLKISIVNSPLVCLVGHPIKGPYKSWSRVSKSLCKQ